MEFGGDVLNFWWRVLLGSRPPTLGLLGNMGLERVVPVAVPVVMRVVPGLVLLMTAVMGPLHILLVRGLLAIGAMA